MNNPLLERLIKSIKLEGIAQKRYWTKTIAIALWNNLTNDERQQINKELELIAQQDKTLLFDV